MFCTQCGAAMDASMKFCPSCGLAVSVADAAAPAAPPAEPKRPIWPWIVGIPVGLFVLLMVIGSLADGGGDHAKKQRIAEECAKMLSDSTLGAERRMTRQICNEMMAR